MIFKSFKTDILFTGYYGYSNVGDDSFVEVSAWGANKFWNKKNVRFISKSEKLPMTLNPVKGYPYSISRTYSLQNKLLLSNTGYLISAGGSTLNSVISSKNIKSLAILRKNSNSNLKIGGIGISIGPFKSIEDEKSVINYVKCLDFLCVRDQFSYEYLKSFNLPYNPVNSFDLAALLPNIYGYKTKIDYRNEKKVIGISICPYESLVDINNIKLEIFRNNKTIELLKCLDKKGDFHFKFFVINGDPIYGDMNLTKEVIRKVSPKSYELVNYTRSTSVIWSDISTCDFIFSTRLHAAIFACFLDIPFMLNEYHRKCSDFLNTIHYNPDYRVGNGDFDCNIQANKILDIVLYNRRVVSKNKILEMMQRAELNFSGVDLT